MVSLPAATNSPWRKLLFLSMILIIAVLISFFAFHNVLISAVVMGGIVIIAVSLFWPWSLTLLVLFLLYSNTVVIAVQFHNVPFIASALFPGLLLIPLIKIVVIDREKIIINRTLILMFLFVSIQAVGAIRASRPDIAMDKITSFLLEGIVLYFLVLNTVRTPRMLKLSAWAVIAAGLLMGSISFYQEITHTYDNNYWGYAQWGTAFGTGKSNLLGNVVAPRLEGPIGDDNRYAQVMSVIAPLAFLLGMGEQDVKFKLLSLAATFIIVIGTILTYSRGGLIALAVIVILMIILRSIKLHYLGVLIIFALLIPLVVPNFANRLDSFRNITLSGLLSNSAESGINSADSSVQSRATEIISSLLMFSDFPFFGVGSGNYAVHYQEYAPKAGFDVKLANRQPHTLYGGIAAENGFFGIVCFLAILGVTLLDLYRARRGWLVSNFYSASIATGLFLGVIAYMTTGLFLHLSFIRFLFLILAMAGATEQIYQSGLFKDAEAAQ